MGRRLPLKVVDNQKESAPGDQLPDGVTKEDLVKADPPQPLYLSEQHQALIGQSSSMINLYQAQAEAAVSRLETARAKQEIQARDILEEMGFTRKTHKIDVDQSGRCFVSEIKKST